MKNVREDFLTIQGGMLGFVDRFGDDQARLLQEMYLFSSANVKRGYAI
jgi:hypothetical protein